MEELQLDVLPLLIPTANNKNDHGSFRECFTLNPSSISPTHQEMFKFLGNFIGFTIRSKSPMDWRLAPIFWKLLLGDQVVLEDLEQFDVYAYQMLK